MNRYKKLIGNSIIFAIGNLGSKIISIILVPLYTYYLTTTEYGLVDIVITTSSMILPIVSLSIYEAALRFVMEKSQDENVVITNSLMITIIGSIISLALYPLLKSMNVLNGLLEYMVIILILQAFQTLFAQVVRAFGKIQLYAVNGIIMTLVTGGMNILLLVYFDMGIDGYLLSMVIANIVSIVLFFLTAKIYKNIKITQFDRSLIKNMLIYSVPLIPNALMWWVINASNRYFILFFVGASANGLFAVANKIPSLLSILNTIFFKAWQLSAIEEFESKNKSQFYSEVFQYLSMVMFLGASGIIMVLKFVIEYTVSEEFYTSWKFVPFLLLGVIFSSFSAFLGTNYIAAKQTMGVFKTSVFGGVINVISNLIFVPLLGTNGAGLSTMLSFFVIWLLRVHDTKKFIRMKINIKNIVLNLSIIFTQILVLNLNLYTFIELGFELLLFIILLVINRSLFLPIKKIIASRMRRRA